jgi:hypothetical protein
MLTPKDRAEYNRQQKLNEPPCFEVIADYPDNKDFPVGKIVWCRRWGNSTLYWAHYVKDCQGERSWMSEWFEKYPHIFKKINPYEPLAQNNTPVKEAQVAVECYNNDQMMSCFQAGRNYQRGETNEYNGGPDNEYPDFQEYITTIK